MTSPTLEHILKRVLVTYLLIPALAFILLVSCYIAWQQKSKLELQEQALAQSMATSIKIFLENASTELQQFLLFRFPEKSFVDKEFLEAHTFNSLFERIVSLDRNQRVVFSLPDSSRHFVQLSTIFKPGQLEQDFRMQISAPYISRTTNRLSIAMLLGSESGQRLVGEISLSQFQGLIHDFQLPKGTEIFITDRYANILAHQDQTLVEKQVNLGHLKPFSRIQDLELPASSLAKHEQSWRLFNIAPVQSSRWLVVVSRPALELLVPVFKYVSLILLMVVLGLAGAFKLLMARLNKRVVKPVSVLTSQISDIKLGNYSTPSMNGVQNSGFAELRELNDEFRAMSQILAVREASLRQKILETQTLLDNVPLQIWFATDPFTQGAANKSRGLFLDKSLDQVSHRPFSEFMPPDNLSRAIETNTKVFQTKKPLSFEDWFMDGRGRQQLLSVTKTPILGSTQEVEFVVCTAEDVTDLRNSQERLRQLSTAVEQSPASIIITNAQGEITYVNPSFCSVTGFSAQEVTGRNPRILKSGQMPPEGYEKLWRTITSGQTWRGEFHNKKKDGRLFWESASISPIFNRFGKITHFLAIKEDITHRKKAEQELVKAKLEAEAANVAKSEFLANISHEIRTPINGIMGMNNLLLESKLEPEQRGYAETIRSSSDHLLAVVNQILDFSKLEFYKMELETLDFDLRLSMEDILDAFGLQAQQQGVELASLIEPDIPACVQGDPVRIRQILTNLIGNALKFTPRGQVFLHLSQLEETDHDVLLQFEVEDTGIGIPADKLEAIFNPFTQVDGSTTRRFGGTGLGLAICRQLVEMMGGQMGVESAPDSGTRFWFTIRLLKQPKPGKRFQHKPIPEQDLAATRVLVADDQDINRRILRVHLQKWGFQSEVVEDGQSALTALRRAAEAGHPFHIAILDSIMPGLDGESLSQIMAGDPMIKHTMAVMLTSIPKPGDVKRLQEMHICAYLTKPLKETQLYTCLQQLLQSRTEGGTPKKKLITRHSLAEDTKSGIGILVVEDNLTNQKVISSALENLGYHPDVVSSGPECLELLAENEYDLIFMDIEMPDWDGLETTRRVREGVQWNLIDDDRHSSPSSPHRQLSHLNPDAAAETQDAAARIQNSGVRSPSNQGVTKCRWWRETTPWTLGTGVQKDRRVAIIGLTAHSRENQIRKCLEAGMDDCLTKPVAPEDLSRVIQTWITLPERPSRQAAKSFLDAGQFDYEGFKHRNGSNRQLMQEVASLFCEDALIYLQTIRESLKAGDTQAMKDKVHALKGASANVGALGLERASREFEESLHDSGLTQSLDHLNILDQEYQLFQEALTEYGIEIDKP